MKEQQSNPSGPSPVVFVVEDEATIRSLLRRLLESHRYRVIEASSEQTALQCWAKHHKETSLVIMDLVLPEGIAGSRLVEKLREARPDVKVLYTSGYHPDAVSLSMNDTLDAFIQKPFEVPELLQTIQRLLQTP